VLRDLLDHARAAPRHYHGLNANGWIRLNRNWQARCAPDPGRILNRCDIPPGCRCAGRCLALAAYASGYCRRQQDLACGHPDHATLGEYGT